jgi:hypothetical protein
MKTAKVVIVTDVRYPVKLRNGLIVTIRNMKADYFKAEHPAVYAEIVRKVESNDYAN